jgi:DNA-binding transcriptional regulator YiaG
MTTTIELSNRDARLITRGREIVESGELRRVRDALNLTRPRMAALLDISEFTLRSWELYKRTPSPDKLIRIAEVIGNLRRVIDKERAAMS